MLSFVFTPNLAANTRSTLNDVEDSQPKLVGAGRDINAGRDVVINVTKFDYLSDKYLMDGILRNGWFGVSADFKELINKDSNPLMIFPYGNVENQIGFALTSKANASVIVEKLYIKLKHYARCNLRNETNKVLGYVGQINKIYTISEDFDVYPITPLTPDLTNAKWSYKGGDSDLFRVELYFDPYVLYLVSINVNYRDVHTNALAQLESDEFALIRVENGNWGGCLNVMKWFKDSDKLSPKNRDYSEGIPSDIYQLLTTNFHGDPGSMNVFIRNEYLKTRIDEAAAVVKSRPNNKIFNSNFTSWLKAIKQ